MNPVWGPRDHHGRFRVAGQPSQATLLSAADAERFQARISCVPAFSPARHSSKESTVLSALNGTTKTRLLRLPISPDAWTRIALRSRTHHTGMAIAANHHTNPIDKAVGVPSGPLATTTTTTAITAMYQAPNKTLSLRQPFISRLREGRFSIAGMIIGAAGFLYYAVNYVAHLS